jgi:hypothetical protein
MDRFPEMSGIAETSSRSTLLKTYQVHEEVQVDGQVRDEEGSRPSTRVVALHHHIRVAENIASDKRNCFSS